MDDSVSVTELRVHGVGGAAPAALLRTTGFRQVWGDRIAGFYAADVDQRGRAVEAYCWGGMTSRSSSRVLWLLLFPFMLVNLAGWTCSARTRADRWAFAAHRAFGRLAGLAVTLNLLLIVAMASVDLWAYQFGGPTLEDSAPLWKSATYRLVHHSEPGQRLAIGTAVVVATLLALGSLSWQARSRYEQVAPVGRANRRRSSCSAAALPDGVVDPRFFDGAATVRRLVRLHVSAGLAWSALMLAHLSDGGHLGGPSTVVQVLSAAVLVCTIALLACESAGDRLATPLLVSAALLVVGAVAYALTSHAAGVAVGGLFGGLFMGPVVAAKEAVPGMKQLVDCTYLLIFALVLVRLLVMPLIALLRVLGVRTGAGTVTGRRSGHRWPGAPFVLTALSVLSTNIVGIGSLLAVAKALGSPPGQAGPRITVLAGIVNVLPWLTLAPMALILLFFLVECVRYGAAGSGPAREAVVGEYTGRMAASPAPAPPWDAWRCSALPDDEMSKAECKRRTKWVSSIARARTAAGFGPDVRYLLGGVMVLGIVVLAYAENVSWGHTGQAGPFTKVSVTLATLIPVAGLALLRSGWQRPDARRWLGVLWDVGTFWPRSFHPFGPPCYAERAVPDLQRRIRWLHDCGGRVVLVGHSQGSILTAVALAQRTEAQQTEAEQPERPERPLLVTFGSPLAKLYGWAFPAYIHGAVLDLLTDSGPRQRVWRWRNFSYLTDYIGGPVGCPEVDVRLPDPDSAWYVTGEPLPEIRRHTGYWSDEAMWRHIDEMVAEMKAATTPPVAREPSVQGAGQTAGQTAARTAG